MGYYTQYQLSVSEPMVLSPAEIIKQLREENEAARMAIGEDGKTIQSVKWYSNEDDLRAFSTLHPDRLFTLHCVGEDGEEWKVYFKNGKSHKAKQVRTFPPFDENQLS